MRGLYFDSRGLRYRTDLTEPPIKSGFVRIAVEQAAICSTDLSLIDGMYGFEGIPGHEFVGVVEAVSDVGVSEEWLGKRVVGEINISCGTCDLCLRGLRKHCRNRLVAGIRNHGGAFAEYISLPVSNLHLVPGQLDADAAVLAEPVAAVFDILDKASIDASSRVAIVGDGRIAQLAARVFNDLVEDLTVFGKHLEKLQRLPPGVNSAIGLDDRVPGVFDLVIECSGSQSGIETAFKLVRPAGQIVIKTTTSDGFYLPTEQIVVNEIAVLGSRCGNFDKALQFLLAVEKKDQAVSSLVDAHFRLENGLAALDYARGSNVLKVVLSMS